MGRRVLILAAGIGSGHNIAAGVLESCFRTAPDVETVQELDILESTNEVYRTLYDDGYFAMVDAVPWLVGWGYDAKDPPFKLAPWISLWDRINTTSTVKAIKAFRPDIVVCTHFLPTRLVSLMLTRGVLDARLAVVTTDYDFQGLWLTSPFNHFFVARDETKAHMTAIGVPADRITVSGIPVQPGLADAIDHDAILNRYDLRPDRPILLISAGAAGGTYTQTIVQQTFRLRNDFQAVVVCGRNEQLKSQIEGLVAVRGDRYRVLGYATDMPDLMRAATLFVGKPGGLSSSECMAAGLPMILIHPIPGQEVRNSDFLLEEGAAVRCNYETTVGYKIDQLLAEPDRIARMAESARRIGRPEASAQIASSVLADQSAPLWISQAAQKSVHASSERGIAAANLYAGRRVRTLIDAPTGMSAGVITTDQLDSLLPAEAEASSGTNLSLSADEITKLRRRTEPGLVFTLRRMLGKANNLRLELGL
jgi:processive 1,2-diacylglycerol beta-glucosyltransferase